MKPIKFSDGNELSACGLLYKIGGMAGLIAAIFIRRNFDAEFYLLRMAGIFKDGPVVEPGSILEWFELLHQSKLIGLTLLNLFDVGNYLLVGLLFLALCAALKRENEALMAVAIFLTILAVSTYLSSNQAIAMNTLSDQFTRATTGEQQALLLVTGQAVLLIHNNATYAGMGIYPSFLLISIAGLMISGAMLHSHIFNRTTVWIGLIANITGLGYYIILVFIPTAVSLTLSISALFLLIWYIMVGVRLLNLGSIASRHQWCLSKDQAGNQATIKA
jgi:hypothetical protein